MACTEMNRVLAVNMSRRLGVETAVAQGVVNRLEKEGFIKAPGKGKRQLIFVCCSKSQCNLVPRSQDSRRLYNNSTCNPFERLGWLIKKCKQSKLSDMSGDVAAIKLTLSVNGPQ